MTNINKKHSYNVHTPFAGGSTQQSGYRHIWNLRGILVASAWSVCYMIFRMRRRYVLLVSIGFSATYSILAHDIITTPITWDREISRIVYQRCASCHHDDGQVFSLMTYKVARPWAEAIKEEVMERRMPPWGAVKGFGDFRDDHALTPEQLELIVSWVEGGVPEGEEKDLPPTPKFEENVREQPSSRSISVDGEFQLPKKLELAGLLPKVVPDDASFKITAERPDGTVEPLLWFDHYRAKFSHAFFYRNAIELPAGTTIHGIPQGASVLLLPATPAITNATSTP